MKYSTHQILSDGHIQIRQTKPEGTYHRHVIAPNQSIEDEPEDVQKAVKADPDYEKYRTAENAESYEKRFPYSA